MGWVDSPTSLTIGSIPWGRDTHTPALNVGAPAQEPSAFVNKRTSWV